MERVCCFLLYTAWNTQGKQNILNEGGHGLSLEVANRGTLVVASSVWASQ